MTENSPPRSITDASKSVSIVPTVESEETRVFASEDLFAGRSEVEIQHQGESYRLRITRNGKLILHK